MDVQLTSTALVRAISQGLRDLHLKTGDTAKLVDALSTLVQLVPKYAHYLIRLTIAVDISLNLTTHIKARSTCSCLHAVC